MKRLVGVLALAMLIPLPAMALGSFGVRLGAGVGLPNDDADPEDEADISTFAIGAAWQLNLPIIGVEVDALYTRQSDEGSTSYLALPILARVGIPIVPLLKVGAGLETRFFLGAADKDGDDIDKADDFYESMVFYLPILVAVDLDLSVLKLSVDARYHYQLTNFLKEGEKKDDIRVHEFMLFAGAFF